MTQLGTQLNVANQLKSASRSSKKRPLPPDVGKNGRKPGPAPSVKLHAEFDLPTYPAHNPDLSALTPEQADDHYQRWGQAKGRVCSTVASRADFLTLVPWLATVLEIGPYTTPAFRAPAHNVRYLDAFTSDGLRTKALATGMDASGVPDIQYVWQGEDYPDLIRERLAAVFSPHNIEH